MGRSWRSKYARWLTVGDMVSVGLAIGVAHWLRFGSSTEDATLAFLRNVTYLEVSALIAIAWMLALSINHSRSDRIIGSGVEEYRRVWWATLSVFGMVAIISMLFKLEVARGYLMIALPTGVALLFCCRWLARKFLARARIDFGKCITRLLVVGNPRAVRDLTVALNREPWSGYRVVAACTPSPSTDTQVQIPGSRPIPVLGDQTQVAEAVVASSTGAVAVAASEQIDGKAMRNLSWELEGLSIDLLVAPGVIDVAGPRLHMRPVAGLPLIHVEKPQYSGAKRFQKRAFDVVFATFVLLIGFPVLSLIAVLIKITSKGPVFYRQERVGLDGQTFEIIKFRTMVSGADSMARDFTDLDFAASPRDPLKLVGDPRITPVGKFLRTYSLDELPQFINVLKRDMSVVGPRPQVRREVDAYDDDARRRLLVRPGITGLWQISGRSDLSWDDSIRLDLFYVENWSMLGDLLIAVKTLRAVIKHPGAY